MKKTKENLEEIEKIKVNLTVKPQGPPQFVKDVESFPVFQETDNHLIIPRYYAQDKLGIEMKFKKSKIDTNSKFKFHGSLRELQQNIMNEVLPKIKKTRGGMVSLPCGFGKTVCALYLASKLKKKTLVIVHKTFLLNQWKERIEQFTDAKVGQIRQDKIEIEGCNIVIGMLQSISKEKYKKELFSNFGFVIFDEAHHAPSKYFSRSLPIISTKYMLALSATPKRADKLERIINWYFGPMLYKITDTRDISVLVKMYNYHVDDKKFKEAKMPYGKININLPKTINWLTELTKRNDFIVNIIKDLVLEEGRQILLLSDRVNHLEKIKELLDNKNIIDNDFYIGKMKQAQLDISSKKQIILGTYSMASEALDIPSLNTLIMVTSRRNIEQSVGRILRKPDNEIQPIIIDFNDKLPCFQNQGNARKKYYIKKKYNILTYDIKDNEIIKVYENNEEPSYQQNSFNNAPVDIDDVDFID